MSTEQTDSHKGKIQIPKGWSPISKDEKDNPTKPINEEEGATNEMSPNGNVTQGNETGIGTDAAIQPENKNGTTDSLQTESSEPTDATRSTGTTSARRAGGRHRKESLEEYRQLFLTVPRLEDRKPVFVSREVRDRLDEIARKLGGRGMSVSGFIENLARHHLETYRDDVELWKKL